MNNNELKQIYGAYQPAFFKIFINTDEDLETSFDNYSLKNKATFFHEYIHLQQDLFTIFGLRNIIHVVDTIKSCAYEIYNCKDTKIKLPICLPNNHISDINQGLYSIYWGDSYFEKEFDDVIDYSIVEVIPYKNLNVSRIKLKVNNLHYGEEYEFYFGAFCILESMAYLGETAFFSNQGYGNFPYKIVEKVSEYFFGKQLSNEMLMALCEFSLNSFNPGFFLIDLMNKMSNGNVPSLTAHIEQVFKDYDVEYQGKIWSYTDLYFHFLEVSKNSLMDLYREENYNDISNWIDKTFDEIGLMKKNGFHIYHIATTNKNLTVFENTLSKIGVPIMFDRKYNYFSTLNLNHTMTMAAIFEAYELLNKGKMECGLYEHCKNTLDGDITNSKCKSELWKRANEKYLCPFGQVWKVWALNNYDYS